MTFSVLFLVDEIHDFSQYTIYSCMTLIVRVGIYN